MTDSVFTDLPKETPEVQPAPEGQVFETLVGEGKKFKDQEALAKSKIESDNFIARLQSENEEMRARINEQITIESVMKKLEESKPPVQEPVHQQEPVNQGEEGFLKPEDLEKILAERLDQRDKENQSQSNLREAQNKLIGLYGSPEEVTRQLNRKAQELNTSVKNLEGFAKSNPQIFYGLMGIGGNSKSVEQQGQQTTYKPTGSEAAPVTNHGPIKNDQYYKKLLKEDPKTYFLPKTQQEMYKQAMEQGEKFYE